MTDDHTPEELSTINERTPASWLGLYVRGLAMGVAELIPGVSGGTIAFVSGIYDEFLTSLAGLRPQALQVLFSSGLVTFWRQTNLNFLLVLAAGMATSVFLLAHMLSVWLETYPPVLWGFFFGLIAASVISLSRGLGYLHLVWVMAGLLVGIAMSWLSPGEQVLPPWGYFVGGMLAITAWMLPAVSGSYVLVLLGLYGSVLTAIAEFDWVILSLLGAGMITGLLVFSRGLAWLMKHFERSLIALLSGLLAGSLVRIWPWRSEDLLLLPDSYTLTSGLPAYEMATIVSICMGAVCVVLLAKMEK